MLHKLSVAVALAALSLAPQTFAEGEAPSVDKVITDLAAIGPDALLARVVELKTQVATLTTQANEMRTKAGELDAQAAALTAQIAAVEKFTTELAKAMNPSPPAEATPAEAAPAPAAEAAAPAAAPAAEAAPAAPVE